MRRTSEVYSDELIEEIERLQAEFGRGKCQLPDPLEGWWHHVSHIEFDPATQTYRFVPED
jgi:hypothetical protein